MWVPFEIHMSSSWVPCGFHVGSFWVPCGSGECFLPSIWSLLLSWLTGNLCSARPALHTPAPPLCMARPPNHPSIYHLFLFSVLFSFLVHILGFHNHLQYPWAEVYYSGDRGIMLKPPRSSEVSSILKASNCGPPLDASLPSCRLRTTRQ